jgi:hypothetical protein
MSAKKRMASDSGPLALATPAAAEAPETPPPVAPASPAPGTAAAPAVPQSAGRRPYQAPRILFREPLEAMASICSPHPPAKANKGACPMGPISS